MKDNFAYLKPEKACEEFKKMMTTCQLNNILQVHEDNLNQPAVDQKNQEFHQNLITLKQEEKHFIYRTLEKKENKEINFLSIENKYVQTIPVKMREKGSWTGKFHLRFLENKSTETNNLKTSSVGI